MYSFGRGVFRRHETVGADTQYRTLYRLRESQLVVSRLKAFEGAVALVTAEDSGALVSQEFPTFDIAANRALPAFVGWLCRWPRFWDLLAMESRGVGARRERIQPTQLLRIRIPLPTVTEQVRLVGILDSIAQLARVVDATRNEVHALVTATMNHTLLGLQ